MLSERLVVYPAKQLGLYVPRKELETRGCRERERITSHNLIYMIYLSLSITPMYHITTIYDCHYHIRVLNHVDTVGYFFLRGFSEFPCKFMSFTTSLIKYTVRVHMEVYDVITCYKLYVKEYILYLFVK